jgi:hypothetical protein
MIEAEVSGMVVEVIVVLAAVLEAEGSVVLAAAVLEAEGRQEAGDETLFKGR